MISRIFASVFICGWLSLAAAQNPGSPAAASELLQRYLAHATDQRAVLRDVSQEVSIDAQIPEMAKEGTLRALRHISKLGKVTYETLSVFGDNMVKKHVIANYVEADIKASGNTDDSLAINEQNYRFRFDHMEGEGDWQLYLYELKPRKKRAGLFEGWMWIEAKSALPVRESGRFVKNPSVYLKRVEFVRDYRLRDGVAVPLRIESTIRTRLLVGPANLEIQFGEISPHEAPQKVTARMQPVGG